MRYTDRVHRALTLHRRSTWLAAEQWLLLLLLLLPTTLGRPEFWIICRRGACAQSTVVAEIQKQRQHTGGMRMRSWLHHHGMGLSVDG